MEIITDKRKELGGEQDRDEEEGTTYETLCAMYHSDSEHEIDNDEEYILTAVMKMMCP